MILRLHAAIALVTAIFLTACVSGSDDLGLRAANDQAAAQEEQRRIAALQQAEQLGTTSQTGQNQASFSDPADNLTLAYSPQRSRTWLINGLASSVDAIGYGLENLAKKIPNSEVHSYASFVESSTIIRTRVTRDIRQAYRNDPGLQINLVGISFGANIVTLIANDLHRDNIPVNYLATLEGPAMIPVRDNVEVADNFSCTHLDCFRTSLRLAASNKRTRLSAFRVKSSHIPLGDNDEVHRRIILQSRQ